MEWPQNLALNSTSDVKFRAKPNWPFLRAKYDIVDAYGAIFYFGHLDIDPSRKENYKYKFRASQVLLEPHYTASTSLCMDIAVGMNGMKTNYVPLPGLHTAERHVFMCFLVNEYSSNVFYCRSVHLDSNVCCLLMAFVIQGTACLQQREFGKWQGVYFWYSIVL